VIAPTGIVALRFDWGDLRGDMIIELEFESSSYGITSASIVTVSSSECIRAGGSYEGTRIGAAYFTVFNVAIYQTTVSVRLRVDSPTNLRVCIDYNIVVDPTPWVIS
jgi:hypothetical protein